MAASTSWTEQGLSFQQTYRSALMERESQEDWKEGRTHPTMTRSRSSSPWMMLSVAIRPS